MSSILRRVMGLVVMCLIGAVIVPTAEAVNCGDPGGNQGFGRTWYFAEGGAEGSYGWAWTVFNNYTTYYSVVNPGNVPASVRFWARREDGAITKCRDVTVPAHGRYTEQLLTITEGNSGFYSVIVSSLNGVEVVSVNWWKSVKASSPAEKIS